MRRTKASGGAGNRALRTLAAFAGALAMGSALWAQTAPASGASKPHRTHKPRAAQPVIATPPAEAAPPQAEAPKWPANEAPSQPRVTWNSQGLLIQASNSSLSQILNAVSTQTGAKIEGANGDERVFGDYGPGTARDVLSQLLRGSKYNFLMLGDQGQGTPRQVILTARRTGGGSNQNHPGTAQQDPQEVQQDEEPPEQPEPPPEEPPQPIQPQPQQVPPPGEQMTPEQRMQLMQQQRLQQMQQLQQQYQQQQQQQPQQQPQ
ncbi:MAG TPA: hypothetical protein VGL22_05055 [Terracidiphilus sp.]